MSAMYFTLLKKQRTGENGGVVKLFFKGFKDNFKQSTISWSLFLLISFIFTLDFNLLARVVHRRTSSCTTPVSCL